jgi:hypothetical protein
MEYVNVIQDLLVQTALLGNVKRTVILMEFVTIQLVYANVIKTSSVTHVRI